MNYFDSSYPSDYNHLIYYFCRKLNLDAKFAFTLVYDQKYKELSKKQSIIKNSFLVILNKYNNGLVSSKVLEDAKASYQFLESYLNIMKEQSNVDNNKVMTPLNKDDNESFFSALEQISQMSFCFYDGMIKIIEEKISQTLNEADQKIFDEFFKLFLDFWQYAYNDICTFEFQHLTKKDITMLSNKYNMNYVVGVDEIIKNKAIDGANLIRLSTYFSKKRPNMEATYLLTTFLKIFAKFHYIDFSLDEFNDVVIYSFDATSRLLKIKEEYLYKFGYEVRHNLRNSPLVDVDEMLDYTEKRISLYNKKVNPEK